MCLENSRLLPRPNATLRPLLLPLSPQVFGAVASCCFPPLDLMIARGRKFITAPRLSRKQRTNGACCAPLQFHSGGYIPLAVWGNKKFQVLSLDVPSKVANMPLVK